MRNLAAALSLVLLLGASPARAEPPCISVEMDHEESVRLAEKHKGRLWVHKVFKGNRVTALGYITGSKTGFVMFFQNGCRVSGKLVSKQYMRQLMGEETWRKLHTPEVKA